MSEADQQLGVSVDTRDITLLSSKVFWMVAFFFIPQTSMGILLLLLPVMQDALGNAPNVMTDVGL